VQAIYEQFRLEQAGPNPTAQELQFISETRMELEAAANGFSPQRQTLTQPLAILMIVVGLVLLVACANIASLLLARSTARRREMAVRLAIGAGASRIVRQLLVESLVLAAAGGALGLLLARWGTNVLAVFAQSGPVRSAQDRLILDVGPSLRVLAFTAGICLFTGILFGLAPALGAARVSISSSLLSRGASSSPPGQRFGAGKALAVSQIALSLLLLIGSGLFVRTLRNLKSRDLGFDQQHMLMVWLAPGQTGRWGEPMAALYKTMEERISSLPGVRAASPSVYGMLQGNLDPGTYVKVPGYVPQSDADLRAQWSIVGPRYFETLGLERLAGRNFAHQDTAAGLQVTILNESMARHFFGSESPLGRHFEAWGVSREIIGVVRDAKYQSPREQGRLMFYLPFRQQLRRLSQTMCLAVRTDGNPFGLAASIRQELRNIDASLPALRVETVEDQLNELLSADRLIATLSGFFSGLAVLLACLGLYGVMAYTTARRTNEIGIRMALGATRGAVLKMVLRGSLVMVVAGVAIGLPLTLAATRMISARLFGISPTDPFTIGAATLLLMAVAALAGFLPAQRASQVDPMVALRYE
jgi:predicted permease